MYYNVKICSADKVGLDNLLDRYVKQTGKQMTGFMTNNELQAIKDDLDLIIKIRKALESAEEIPHGKE